MGDRVGELDPYVPRIASDWDLHAEGSSWRSVEGSLVFVDISGFTSLSERLARRGRIGAEELTGVLNRVFGEMLEIVFSRGGSLLKFGGDALLLLFDTADHVLQACAATVEMRRALRDASREKTSVGRIDLKMSSGVHTGSVDFFLVGESHRELLVTGPTASRTTEMESTADAGEIVVSEEVRAQLPSGFTGEQKGDGWLLKKRTIHADPCGPVLRAEQEESDLSRFIPAQLRDHLASGLSDSEHRIATIAFLKFKGIDEMLAQRGPEAVGASLDELVTAVQNAADQEEVTFLASDIDADGGKIILATGVPSSRHDDEGRILRAAREILDSDHDLTVRIGVNRGHVFAGDVGTSFRRTFTVMGDTVNLAARLMAAAGPGSLYASPAVLDESSTLFRTEALEPFFVKGKEDPVTAYEVFEETGVRPPELKNELPFHGREPELEMLVSIVTTCARVGRGGMMTISGDTGIGKTRLIAEVIERCPGLATLMVKAEPNGSDNPYWAFRDPLRRELGIERSDRKTMQRDLEKKVKSIDRELSPLVPLLGDVLHIDIADTPTTAMIDPQFRPGRTADVVVDLLSKKHSDPFALILEDGQWLDEASRNLIIRLGTAAESRPWTVIATMRNVDESNADLFGDGIALPPLDDGSIRQIAIEATAAAPLRPHELDNVVNRAGGNPLFLSEILSVIRETGSADDIPDSLDAVVSTQIDSLPPLARQTLRYSSVLGTSFPTAVLEEFLAPDDIEVDEATRSVLSRFIEGDGESRLRFRHAVVHDVAYRGLSYRRLKELHGRAGDVVEAMSGDDPSASAEFLAYHFAEADRYEKAWDYSRVAARKARDAYANSEAAVHYTRALDSARHIPDVPIRDIAAAWTGLAEVNDMAGDYETARKALSRAVRASRNDPVRTAELQLRRAETWMGTGNLVQAKRSISVGRTALASADPGEGDAVLAKLAAYESSIHGANGDPFNALRAATDAVDLATAAGEQEALARAYGVLDWANFVTGRDAPRMGEEAIRIFQELGLLERSVGVMNNMGVSAYLEGDWNEALRWYQQSLETSERSGNVFEAALAKANIGELLVGQRRYTEAVPLLNDARRTYIASGATHYMPLVDIQLAKAAIGLGDVDKGIESLREIVETGQASVDPAWAEEAAFALIEALAMRGDSDDAMSILAGMDPASARTGLARALIDESLGDTTSAQQSMEDALRLSVDSGDLLLEALAREALQRLRQSVDPDAEHTDTRLIGLFDGLGVRASEPVD